MFKTQKQKFPYRYSISRINTALKHTFVSSRNKRMIYWLRRVSIQNYLPFPFLCWFFTLGLISGETSAGKSSMLNLMLGEELLPFSVLSTTSTICELKYGRDRRIKVHYEEEGKDPKVKRLDELSSYMDQISEFVHIKSARLRKNVPQYKKVELFWPHSLLRVRISFCT